MKTIGQILLVALFCSFVTLSNTLQAQTERTLQPFDAISVTGNIDVILEAGERESLKIFADGIPEDKIIVKISNGELRLKLLNSVFYKNDKVKIYVTYQQLRGIRGVAGANVESNSTIQGDKLTAKAGSGALLDIEVNVNAITASASEGGVLKLEGETKTQNTSATTGGHVDGLDLSSSRTYVKANTGGHAEVVANDFIEASANTGGRVEYKGNPAESNTKTLMSGGVRKL